MFFHLLLKFYILFRIILHYSFLPCIKCYVIRMFSPFPLYVFSFILETENNGSMMRSTFKEVSTYDIKNTMGE